MRAQQAARPSSCVGRRLYLVLLILLSPLPASARSGGITTLELNPNTNGCNLCHAGGTPPQVAIEGPTQVAPGTTSTFVFRVFTGGQQRFAGFNASAPDGTLATGGPDSAQTQALPGTGERIEITHAGRKAAAEDAVRFSFLWTAPDVAGVVALRLWGNAVNGNGQNTGDRASTLLVPIEVRAEDPPTPTPTPTPTVTPTPISVICPGNCNGDTEVTVDEILAGVSIAQGLQSLEICPQFDANGDGEVTIDDILAAVGAALNGCPA